MVPWRDAVRDGDGQGPVGGQLGGGAAEEGALGAADFPRQGAALQAAAAPARQDAGQRPRHQGHHAGSQGRENAVDILIVAF